MHQFYTECAYFTAARYLRSVEKLTNEIFKPTGFSPAYNYILLFLEDYGTASITEIANELGYERTTVSRLVKKLVNEGLIKIETNGRKSEASLTESAQGLLVISNQCLAELKRVTDEKLGSSKAVMTDALTENYQKLEGVK